MSRASGNPASGPVELGDDEGVTGSTVRESLAEAGPRTVGAGEPVVEIDAFRVDAQRGQLLLLRGQVLAGRGHPGVADPQSVHRSIVAVQPP
jgi:hypothetical protein